MSFTLLVSKRVPNGERVEHRNENGLLHRVEGPAIEWENGLKEWWLNGKRHRVDGPAIEHPDGTKTWYLNDVDVAEKDHSLLVLYHSIGDGQVVKTMMAIEHRELIIKVGKF